MGMKPETQPVSDQTATAEGTDLPVPQIPAPPRPARIQFLDGIRALAALFVVAHHIYIAVYPGFPENTGPWFLGWLLYGHFAVAAFIVVSGFSLTLAPAKGDYHLSKGFGSYISRRAWRILPPYWAAVIVSSLLMVLVVQMRMDVPLTPKDVVVHLLLLQTAVGNNAPNGALWSIAIEWQLYFFFPIFLVSRRRLGPAATAVGGVIGVWLLYQVAVHVSPLGRILHLSPQFAALFIFGMIAAGATARSEASGRRVPWGWITIGLTVALVALFAAFGSERLLGQDLYWADLGVGAAMACGLAALVGTGSVAARRVLEHRRLVGIGHFSYSLYLVHAPLLLIAWLFVVEPMHLSPNGSFAVMVVGVAPLLVLASYGFFLVFERPFLNRRAGTGLWPRWSSSSSSSPSAAPS